MYFSPQHQKREKTRKKLKN